MPAARSVVMRSRLARAATYGAVGLAAELAFTGTKDLVRSKGRTFRAHTSPWMFPVYGLAQPLFEPAHDLLRDRAPTAVRALAYAVGFTIVEYGSGRVFQTLLGRAPWDYSHARWNLHGLVRAGYAPLWALAGLGLERVHDALVRS
jgi:uncharacterized membrane protein